MMKVFKPLVFAVLTVLLGCEPQVDYQTAVHLVGQVETVSEYESRGQVCADVRLESLDQKASNVFRLCSDVSIDPDGQITGIGSFKTKTPDGAVRVKEISSITLRTSYTSEQDRHLPLRKKRVNTYSGTLVDFHLGNDSADVQDVLTVNMEFQLKTWDLVDIVSLEDRITACTNALFENASTPYINECVRLDLPLEVIKACSRVSVHARYKISCMRNAANSR
jgi:hypothetical protein